DAALAAEKARQLSNILGRDRPRLARLLARETEGDALRRRERRPVPFGQAPRSLQHLFFVQARDREQHFAVAHSVEALQRPRHDPEQALLEDPVLFGFLAEAARAGAPAEGKLRLITDADQAPTDAQRA